MTFVDAIKTCLTKYVDFQGRAARSEYWYWVLFVVIASAVLGTIDRKLSAAFSLAALLPNLSVGARRLHDIDRSGWWQLIYFVPILGWIIWLVWCCTRGADGVNRFGANPLDEIQDTQALPPA